MNCRPHCAACCIALSISSHIPGSPGGKPAGVVCIQLDQKTLKCRIWGTDEYPAVCREFTPKAENCGLSREEALQILSKLEQQTSPD